MKEQIEKENKVYLVYRMGSDSDDLISIHKTEQGAKDQCAKLWTPRVQQHYTKTPFFYEVEPLQE